MIDLFNRFANILDDERKTFFLENCIKVNIQNVADFMYTKTDKEFFDRDKDFPNCVPPWQFAWFHWIHPTVCISKEKGMSVIPEYAPRSISHLTMSVRLKDDCYCPNVIEIEESKIMSDMFGLLRPMFKSCKINNDYENNSEWKKIKWLFQIQTFYEALQEPICLSAFFLDENGMLFRPRTNKNTIYSPHIYFTDNENFKSIVGALEDCCLLALSFCNCKKSQIVEQSISRQVRRNSERHNIPIVKEYTLEIPQVKTVYEDIEVVPGSGIKKAFHLCRGHFKTYTKEKPLMGKHQGTFWWDMHLKGSSEYGIIDKDYKI